MSTVAPIVFELWLIKVTYMLLFSSSITLEKKDKTKFLSMIRRRNKGEPLAYILGSKGFWNLDIEVNNKVLVPRPETEIIVEDVLLNKYGCIPSNSLNDLNDYSTKMY